MDPDKLPELLEEMKSRMATWEALSETLSINDIETFANELGALGESYGSGRLAKWGEELANQASMFELDKMGVLMKEYPNLVSELENLQSA